MDQIDLYKAVVHPHEVFANNQSTYLAFSEGSLFLCLLFIALPLLRRTIAFFLGAHRLLWRLPGARGRLRSPVCPCCVRLEAYHAQPDSLWLEAPSIHLERPPVSLLYRLCHPLGTLLSLPGTFVFFSFLLLLFFFFSLFLSFSDEMLFFHGIVPVFAHSSVATPKHQRFRVFQAASCLFQTSIAQLMCLTNNNNGVFLCSGQFENVGGKTTAYKWMEEFPSHWYVAVFNMSKVCERNGSYFFWELC